MKRQVELLSPAGSIEAMKAAVNAGCDAVYMGGSRFGARAYADNPENSDMAGAIEYMHARGKKIYITVNTLVKQSELKQLEAYIDFLAANGADALIVQDMGVLQLVAEKYPKMHIHASTQMTLLTPEAISILPENVTRIVPARELSIKELTDIKSRTDKELEVFVHGALCFSYSGQCLFSSAIGGRSGNRGRCAQPCRQLYSLHNISDEESINSNYVNSDSHVNDDSRVKDGYLLCMKDLCTVNDIPRLIEAGIDSFKIEGRMKNPIYTAGVTDIYRRAIDLYYERNEKGFREWDGKHQEYGEDINKMLLELYNRGGFHKGYFDVKNGPEMIEDVRPNHNGILVGKVKKAQGRMAFISFDEITSAGDVVEIRDNGASVYEFTIGKETEKAKEIQINCGKYKPVAGLQVYRTKNKRLNDFVEANIVKKEYRIPVTAHLKAKKNEQLMISVSIPEKYIDNGAYRQAFTAEECGAVVEPSQKQPTSVERIKEQLFKNSESCFYINEAEIEADEDIFIPVSRINELRRNVLMKLELLAAGITMQPADEYISIEKEETAGMRGSRSTIAAKVSSYEQFREVCNISAINEIIIEYAEADTLLLQNMISDAAKSSKKLTLALPYICRKETYERLKADKQNLCNNDISSYLIRNMEEYKLLTEEFAVDTEKIRTDYTLHTLNKKAKAFWKQRGVNRFTVSTELMATEMSELEICDSQLVIYGRLPVMLTAQCQRKNSLGCARADEALHNTYLALEDKLGHIFPVKNVCKECYNIIYNDAYLALTDYSKEIEALNAESVRFEFTDEKPEKLQSIIASYTDGSKIKSIFDDMHFTNGSFRRLVE